MRLALANRVKLPRTSTFSRRDGVARASNRGPWVLSWARCMASTGASPTGSTHGASIDAGQTGQFFPNASRSMSEFECRAHPSGGNSIKLVQTA